MLLAIDIGNTKTVVGLFAGTKLTDSWYFDTDAVTTEEDAAVQLQLVLDQVQPDIAATVNAAAISCVVANLTKPWARACAATFRCRPSICTASNAKALGLFDITFDNLDEIGPDLVADAIAARSMYGSPVAVVDFGTATTIEFIDADGKFAGVSIAPGAESSMAALFKEADAIATVPVEAPAHVLGINTVEAVQSGIVFGEAARADGLLTRGFAELGYTAPAVATGGLCELVSAYSEEITAVDKFLTLKGLQMLYAARVAHEAAKKAAEAAVAAQEAGRQAAEEEARAKALRAGEFRTVKVQALKGSPLE